MTNYLTDKNFDPTDENIANVLGETMSYWNKLWEQIRSDYSDITKHWKYYPDKTGWVLQVLKKKKTLFWLKPYDGFFSIAFWFGDKAVAEVEKSNLPEKMKEELTYAKKYMIERNLTIKIKSLNDTKYIMDLIKIKLMK